MNTYEQIEKLIRIELLKRGFIVDVTCTPTRDNHFKVKTTSFQTTPVLFQEVWIESSKAFFSEHQKENGYKYTDYYVSLSANYKHFDDGINGCNLFIIEFRMFSDNIVRILSIR